MKSKNIKKLNKVAGISDQDSGVGFYRIAQPLSFLKREKLVKEVVITPSFGTQQHTRITESTNKDIPVWNERMLMQMAKDSDVIISTLYTNFEDVAQILNLRKWSGAKWVVDIDDDLYHIPVANPAKESNDRVRSNWETCFKLADGLTVSVPMLKETYKHLNKNIYVNPNGFDFDEVWNFSNGKNKTKKIRIGWRGSLGHRADLQSIQSMISQIQKDYDVTFVTFGDQPPFKSEHHTWVERLADYPKGLANLNLDIAVVPLIENDYNKCKTNIAVGEFSALKIPVVASPTENQKDIDGVLYATNQYEWYDCLEKLILDKHLREQNGQLQYDYMKKNYSVSTQVKGLSKWFLELPRKKDL